MPIRIAIINGQNYMAAHDVSEALKFENPKGEVIRLNMENHKYDARLIDWEPNLKEFVVDYSFIIDLTLRAQQSISAQFIRWMINQEEGYISTNQRPPVNTSNHIEEEQVFAITQIAKQYNMTGKMLNDFLCANGVQFKVNDQWVLIQQYAEEGYMTTKIVPKRNSEGQVLHSYWTEKGINFIENLLKDKNIVKANQLKLF